MPTEQAYDPLDFSSYTPDWAGGESEDTVVLPTRSDEGYASQRRRLESGGKSDAKNPNSSAYGPDQFLKGTWMELINKYSPSWSQGKSESELLEMRADPDKSAEMVALFDQDNADYLASRDIPATNMNLYLAHHFGKGGAAEIVESSDNTPMRDIVSSATYKANPHLQGKTKGEVLADFERRGIDQGPAELAGSVAAPSDPLDFSKYTPDWATAVSAVLPKPASFTEVTSNVDTTATEDAGLTSLDTAGKAFVAGAADIVSDIMFRDTDAQAAEQVRKQKEEQRIAESSLPEGLARVLHTDILSPITSQVAGTLAKTEGYKAVFSGLDKYLTQTRQEVAAETADIMATRPVQGYVERAITDVASSPQSLASIPGGIFAAIPAATSYNDAYRAAREAGASPEDANEFAELQAATEGGISAIPAGKVLSILGKPFAKKAASALVKPLTGRLARVARTAVGESIEEATQTVASDAVSRAQAESADGEEARAFAAGRISQDLLSDTLRSAAAGAVGGTALGAPHAAVEYAQEAGRQAAETTKAAVGSFNKQRDVKEKGDIEFDQDLNRQLAEELAKTQAREAQDKLDQEAAAQKAVEEEAGFRTIERDAGKPAPTIVREDREGTLTREQIAPAREVVPDAIVAEQEAAAEEEAARVARVEQAGLEKTIKGQRTAKAKKDKSKERAEKAKQTKARNEVARQLTEEFPNLSEQELAPVLKERLAGTTPAAKPQKPVIAAPVKSDKAVGDKEIADLASQLGVTLGMRETLTLNKGTKTAAEETPAAPVKFDRPAFESKVGQIVKGLVKKNRQDTADVQNLLRQEKLVLAPNPETIGRAASENAAEYDPTTNQMYIYTDRVDPKDTTGVMARALHEATHAGQFNDRTGRPDLFKQMMSSDKENAASKRILALDGKNTLATAAVAKAKAASPDADVQDLELVPYFVTEAVKARGNAGRLNNVVNDVVANARTFMRDKLGVDLDVSLDDLASAAQQVGGEIVRTDTSKKRTGNTLAMIAGPSATGFKKAQSQGRTYQGARDFGERFEIPDNQAELTTDKATFNNIVAGETTPLSEVLAHDALYEQYPDLKKVNVKADPEMVGGSVYANYDPETNSINVNPVLLRNAVVGETEMLRNKILHETQHAIQTKEGFVPGANAGNFIPRSLRRQAEDASAKFQKVVKDFDLGRAVSTLNANARNMWDQNINSGLAETRDAQAQMFLEEGFYQDSSDRMIARYGDKFKAAQQELNQVSNQYFAAEQKAFQTYLRDYGETEARTTEARSRKSEKELAEVTPEENMATAEGKIPVERTIDSTPFVGGIRQAPESSAVPQPLYRETNADGAVDMVEGMTRNLGGLSTAKNSVFASTTPELALGQGNNTGVVLKLDPAGYDSKVSNAKPAAEFLNTQGQSEVQLTNKAGVNSGEHVMSVTLNKGWKAQGDRNYAERLLLRMRQGNWARTENEDGSITYTNPKYTATRTLGMAQETPAELKQKRTPSWLTGLFDSAQGVGRSINEVIEFARSSPAEGRMVAEASLEKYDIALRQLANERDTTPEALNKEISTKLDEIDAKQDGFEANREAFNKVAQGYGDAGQAMVDLRNQIDDLTLDIIRQRAANGNPLTEAEQKKYKTLLNNLGRYSHRQYAVNSGDMGKKYSKTVWKDYENAKKGKGLDKERVRKNYVKVDQAVTYLVDNNLYIPDDTALNGLSADRVRSLYNVWGKVGSPEGLTLEQMKEELAQNRDAINGNKDRLTKAAESITQELLGLADPISSVTNYYRGGKQDNSILKERKAIPPELRNLMGEIKDPAMRLMLTAGKQAEFVARNSMLLQLRDMVGTEIQPPDAAGTDAVKGMQKLEGETWGPLEGYYVSKNMRNLVGDTVQQLATFEQAIAMAATRPGVLGSKALQAAFDKWGTVAAVSKVANIVGNPVNFLYNFIGAPRMMLSNGNLNPKYATKALQTSAELIAYAMNPATATESAIEANKYGITDSAFVGEIKNAEYRQLQGLIKGMSGKNPNELWAKAKTLGVGVKELYAMMDVWSKLANFYHQKQVLTDFYKAEGVSRTDEQIAREAADNTNRTNITYKRAAPLVKALERGGITQFGTYFYEVFRSEIANAMQGVDELRKANSAKTSEGATIMRVQAAKRLAGQATSWALTAALAHYLSALAFGDDDEENKDRRALLPEYMRNQDFIPIGTDAKGNPVLFNWSRIDPIGPVTDIMRSIMHEGATPEQVSKSIFDLYVAPRVGTQLLTAMGSMFSEDVRPSRQPTVQQIMPSAYTTLLRTTNAVTPLEDRQTKAWTNVVESFLPGIVNSYRDTNVRPLREDFASTVANAGSYLGASMYKLNPENAAKSASMDYSGVLKNARKDVKEVFGDYEGGPTTQDLVPKILDLREKEKAAYDEARRVYKGMLAVGVTPTKAAEAFKDNRLAGDVIKQVQSGRFESRIISKDSIGTYMKNEQAGKSRQEKKEIKKKWDSAWKLLSATDKELNEEQE